ncbi:MAG TPA: hypothetical protein VFO76_01480, partial [Candidatus Kapabacteria bacterium]|nr:hypothetical protein [Candidatus Kapabacteria bacterium]
MSENLPNNILELVKTIALNLREIYWMPLHEYIKKNPTLIDTVAGFLLKPESIIFYIGRTHMAIEYMGPERIEDLENLGKIEITGYDF